MNASNSVDLRVHIAALVADSNVAAPIHLEDDTQPALPVVDERRRAPLRTIQADNVPPLDGLSQIEALTCANRRKDQFLVMLSHELSGPLAAIHHAARFLRPEAGDAATQKQMQALLQRQLARMTHIVNELHDISQIASGHLHLQRERVDLRDILRHTIETLEWELEERHHRLVVELPAAPVWLRADPRRLEQVFVNLLANASRCTDDGAQVSVCVQSKHGEAIVRIRHGGPGSASDPRSGAGLGAGLAVVLNLIELHRGNVISASAAVGRGGELTVRLPAEE